MAKNRIQWRPEDDARLRALWDAGHSTAEIGRMMGQSKNSVVGRAHRLRLPPRPSPICEPGPRKMRGTGKRIPRNSAAELLHARQRSERVRAATPRVYAHPSGGEGHPSPGLQRLAAAHHIPAKAGDPTAAVSAARGCEAASLDVSSLTLPAPQAAVLPAARGFSPRDPRGCRWPEGEPRTEGFRFCGEAVRIRADGRFCVYCAAHAARAFTVRVADAGEPAPIGRTNGWGRAA